MEVIDAVLQDWRECKPDGVVLRASRLGQLLDRVVVRVTTTSGVDAENAKAALDLLTPSPGGEENGLPVFVQHLQIDGTYRTGAPRAGTDAAMAVVHFVFFWRALHEVWHCLRRMPAGFLEIGGGTPSSEPASLPGAAAVDDEPFADEATQFRDRVLSHVVGGVDGEVAGIFRADFDAELRVALKNSTDPSAWAPLEAMLAVTDATAQAPLALDQVSSLLLCWLAELTEDYRRGERWDHICSVRDVLGCGQRVACLHLGASAWDVEVALRRFYTEGAPLAALQARGSGAAWSSQSAKLRNVEVECPICMCDFDEGKEPVVTQCCYKAICATCASAVCDTDGVLRCPFCRGLSIGSRWELGTGASGTSRAGASGEGGELFASWLGTVSGTARRAAVGWLEASGLQALAGCEAPRRHNLRIDVIFREPEAEPPSRRVGAVSNLHQRDADPSSMQ
mmetsp:Transcript_15367/g.42130  ORF Transcript_15367/g.42130 Transcript_15367/m.42130 type:complete len:452 (-) Transcript_15367:21-1376(-)